MINSDFVKKRVVIYARVSTEHEAQIAYFYRTSSF